MRTIITVLFAVLGIVFCLPYHLYLKQLAKKDQDKAYIKAQKLVKGFFEAVMFLAGCKRTIIGKENIPTDQPVMFVGNHRSYFDILSCHNAIDMPLGFMSKDNIKDIPLLYKYMDDIGCTYLDRTDLKKGLETILQTADIIKSGHSMMIFPEGTRNKVNDTFLPFHEGSFKIAVKGNVPIVPMSIVNAADIFEDHFPKIKKTKGVIEYCDPIYVNDLDKDTRKVLGSYVSNIIAETYFKNKKKYFE